MKTKASLLSVLLLSLSSVSALATPVSWETVPQLSHLTFETKQGDRVITGEFKNFTSTILFDKADLAHSKISVTIQTGSAFTGDSTNDNALSSKDWFNVGAFPNATFETTTITDKGSDKPGVEAYEAAGKLTILGVTRDVVLPFTLQDTEANTHAVGTLPLKRLDYGVGAIADPNGAMVSNDVTVKLDLTAHALVPVPTEAIPAKSTQ